MEKSSLDKVRTLTPQKRQTQQRKVEREEWRRAYTADQRFCVQPCMTSGVDIYSCDWVELNATPTETTPVIEDWTVTVVIHHIVEQTKAYTVVSLSQGLIMFKFNLQYIA